MTYVDKIMVSREINQMTVVVITAVCSFVGMDKLVCISRLLAQWGYVSPAEDLNSSALGKRFRLMSLGIKLIGLKGAVLISEEPLGCCCAVVCRGAVRGISAPCYHRLKRHRPRLDWYTFLMFRWAPCMGYGESSERTPFTSPSTTDCPSPRPWGTVSRRRSSSLWRHSRRELTKMEGITRCNL